MNYLLKSGCKSTFVVLLILALSNAAMAQRGKGPFGNRNPMSPRDVGQANLYEALKDQGVATTITADQLTADWHIISSGELGIFAMFGAGSMMPQIAGFTQGKMVSFGSEKYLVAYYVMDKSDAEAIYSPESNRSEKGFIFKDSTLSLALLPMNGNQSFYEIKKFDPAKDYLLKPVVKSVDSQSNLKQIALGVMQYTQDYDEKFPPMIRPRNAESMMKPVHHGSATVDTVQMRLIPYVKSKDVFLQPVTKRPYVPNYKISRLSLASIENPAATFLFYEDAPDADGMRNVAYVDGHVKRISENEFQFARQAQGISESGYPPAAKPEKKAKAPPKS